MNLNIIFQGKDDLNAENVYNQNFDGLYCSCHRPYPDPDPTNDAADDPMIQCIMYAFTLYSCLNQSFFLIYY